MQIILLLYTIRDCLNPSIVRVIWTSAVCHTYRCRTFCTLEVSWVREQLSTPCGPPCNTIEVDFRWMMQSRFLNNLPTKMCHLILPTKRWQKRIILHPSYVTWLRKISLNLEKFTRTTKDHSAHGRYPKLSKQAWHKYAWKRVWVRNTNFLQPLHHWTKTPKVCALPHSLWVPIGWLDSHLLVYPWFQNQHRSKQSM